MKFFFLIIHYSAVIFECRHATANIKRAFTSFFKRLLRSVDIDEYPKKGLFPSFSFLIADYSKIHSLVIRILLPAHASKLRLQLKMQLFLWRRNTAIDNRPSFTYWRSIMNYVASNEIASVIDCSHTTIFSTLGFLSYSFEFYDQTKRASLIKSTQIL